MNPTTQRPTHADIPTWLRGALASLAQPGLARLCEERPAIGCDVRYAERLIREALAVAADCRCEECVPTWDKL